MLSTFRCSAANLEYKAELRFCLSVIAMQSLPACRLAVYLSMATRLPSASAGLGNMTREEGRLWKKLALKGKCAQATANADVGVQVSLSHSTMPVRGLSSQIAVQKL